MKIRNMTSHSVDFILPGGTRTLAPDPAGPARVAEILRSVLPGEIVGIPLHQKILGEIVGLPAPVPGTALLVSDLVATAAWGHQRADVLAIGNFVRDSTGKVVGAMSLVSHPTLGFREVRV